MIDPLRAYIREHHLLQPGMRLLVAVSGGIDSVVLLDLLARLAPEWRLELEVAHFNHRLRGDDSDADEAFVQTLCAARAIPCTTSRGEVRAWARRHHLGLEAAGRALRYAFLHETARRRGCTVIATGHHAGDQAETVLDRLIRGAGLRGLAGIAPRSPLPLAAAPAGPDDASPAPLWLIRPLLFASRAAIAAWAGSHGLEYREDASNRDRRLRRNRIRHELLPLLTTYNPRIEAALSRAADHLRETEAFLCAEAARVLERCIVEERADKIVIEKEPFLSYFTFLQRYALQQAWRRLSGGHGDITAARWQDGQRFIAAGRTDRPFRAGGAELWLTAHQLVLLAVPPGPRGPVFPALPGRTPLWEGWTLEIKAAALPLEQIVKNRDPQVAWVDGGRLRGALCVRSPRPGDRIHPLGVQGHKKVADLLAEAGTPVYERGRIPLLWCGEELVWICGIRTSETFRVTTATTTLYQLKVEQNLDGTL